MHIDFDTLKRLLPHVIRSRKPILIRGKHGIGKSEIVYQLAPKVAEFMHLADKSYVYPIVERRASQMADAGDLMGLPTMDGETTQFLPMKWFHQACSQPCILFLDEIDRAPSDVRQAIFELTDSRKIAGHTLHKDTLIVACVNGGQGENQYQVGEMDPAELSRWTVFDVKPSTGDWLTHAKEKIEPQIYDFIKGSPSFLEHSQGEFEPNKVYPSRRSWFRLNDALANSGLLEESPHDLLFLASAFVGHEAATQFHDFCKNYSTQVTPEDIIFHGKYNKTANWEINQHANLIDKIGEKTNLFKETLNTKHIENLARYFLTIHAELAMKLWETVTLQHAEVGIALYEAVIDGRAISDYIAELNGAVEEKK